MNFTSSNENSAAPVPETRRKVLAIAFACNPYYGSERGVGWGYVSMLAQFTDLHVIAAQSERTDIERFLHDNSGHAVNRVNFRYIPFDFAFARKLERKLPFYFVWHYKKWLAKASALASGWHGFENFDVIHLVTYGTFRFPGRFYAENANFVWGPVGALENTPWRLLPMMGFRGGLKMGLRNVLNTLQKRFAAAPRRAFIKAGVNHGIIAATSKIQTEIWRLYKQKSAVLSEVGLPASAKQNVVLKRNQGEPLRLVWSGNFIASKALLLLLLAMARLPRDVNVEAHVLGDGPYMQAWRDWAQKLGLTNVVWRGRLTRGEALEAMRGGHVFVQTSLKDLTSTVIVEALFAGMPVITLNHCGFSDVVDNTCGVKITVGSKTQIVRDMAQAIEGFYRDEPRRTVLAQGALKRADNYTWETKLARLTEIYAGVK